MKAVLLAAGVGERLRPFTDHHPKCLAELGGRSLLTRHLDVLAALPQVDGAVVVVGYLCEQIADALDAWRAARGPEALPVTTVVNEAYRLGSILSLYAARETLLGDDSIVMDADVLYHPEVMRRLVRSRHPNCFLIDSTVEETGEEMMVCVRGGLARHIARSRDASTHAPQWELRGEGVGFFRLSRAVAPRLVEVLEGLLGAGRQRAEYEEGLAALMAEVDCGYEEIGDLPWTEIDFPADLDRAARDVLPAIDARQ